MDLLPAIPSEVSRHGTCSDILYVLIRNRSTSGGGSCLRHFRAPHPGMLREDMAVAAAIHSVLSIELQPLGRFGISCSARQLPPPEGAHNCRNSRIPPPLGRHSRA